MSEAHHEEPPPTTVAETQGAGGPAWARLEDQLNWYDRKSVAAQRAYKAAKVAQLVVGAAVPVAALADVPDTLTAILGAVVVVLEGIQQLYQWQTNWVLYRSTAEALKHERYLFLAEAGPYTGRDRDKVLAERIEGLVSQEHAKWTEAHQRTSDEQPDGWASATVTPAGSAAVVGSSQRLCSRPPIR